MRNLAAIKVKANAKYTCQECGSTELIQAHHQIPGDDNSLIPLCAGCHSKRHPDLSKALFFNKNSQLYWHNKSAASLARELRVSSRTIIRIARHLGILRGELSLQDEGLIKNTILKPTPITRAIRARLLLPKLAAYYLGITIQDFYRLVRMLNIPYTIKLIQRRGGQGYSVEYFQKDILTWHVVFGSAEFYLPVKKGRKVTNGESSPRKGAPNSTRR